MAAAKLPGAGFFNAFSELAPGFEATFAGDPDTGGLVAASLVAAAWD